MSIAYWCVFVAVLLPYVLTALAKFTSGTYGARANADPRTWATKIEGVQKRMYAAHLNSFEAFPPFAAAVIIALQMGAAQSRVDMLAMVFIAARIVYALCYIADRARMRSLTWAVGFGCVVALFFAGV